MVKKDEQKTPDETYYPDRVDELDTLGLIHRPRRLRRTTGIRAMVRETRLSADMLIYPLFVCGGSGIRREVTSMPGVYQLSVDEAVRETTAARRWPRHARRSGAIPPMVTFPSFVAA